MTKKTFQAFTQILTYFIKYFRWVVLAAAVLIALSGVYRVDSYEAAVVLRMGRLVGATPVEQVRGPGLHFALPFFIDEVIRVPVHVVHEWSITTHFGIGRIFPGVEMSGYLLTGDNNIVLIRANVRYQISNPVQYALFNSYPIAIIDGVVSGEFTRAVAGMDIDFVLTRGRADLANQILWNSQRIIDELQIGVALIGVELTEIIPPNETAFYFERVASASIAKETSIQQAQEQAATQILRAEAESSSLTQVAISRQAARLSRVHNVMAEFNGLYDQFTLNPEVIRAGTFRSRAAAVLSQAGNMIIVPDGAEVPFIVLP
ncbi:MAG: SPFH domain-containing protein [Treponema sp.]|nr:SPFH domain-containing protein [Treponema sp.]